jgi:hypothetical protein
MDVRSLCEILEARRLLAASLSAGVLSIRGSAGDDAIVIGVDRRHTSKLLVSVNGIGQKFATKAVGSIEVVASAGDDSLRIDHARGDVHVPVRRLSVRRATAAQEADSGIDARPDLQIKEKSQSSYVGDNAYVVGASAPSRSAPAAFFPTVYHLRVQNDSAIADSFLITGTAGGAGRWRVRYYDSQATGYDGGQNVTDAVTLADGRSGWNTGPIAPGAYRDFRVEVLPLYRTLGGASTRVQVTAASRNNPVRVDEVASTTTYTPKRAVQVRRQNFDRSGVYLTTLQNLGNVVDRVRVSGPANGNGYSVRYFDAAVGGNEVTAALTSGAGWTSPELAPGQQIPLRVELSAKKNRERSIRLNIASASDSSRTDFANITNRPSAAAGPGFFVIGAWSQPRGSFDKWKARGINTMVQYESAQATIQEWTTAAVDRGLYMIRRPVPGIVGDIGQKNLIAFAHPDEPDIPSTGHDAAYIAEEYAKWKAALPDIPIFTNYSGGYVNQWQGNPLVGYAGYKPLLDNTDWAASSIYPVTGWDRPNDLDAPGKAVDVLEKYSEGKPQIAVIESSDQELSWAPREIPGPTAGQFRAQVWDSVIKGAKGVVYFPQKFKPSFSFDNTPPEIADEMTAQNARLAALSKVLVGPADPTGLAATVAAPLEAGWRFYKGRAYFIVLNMSAKALKNQTITLSGVGRKGRLTVEGEDRSVSMSKGRIVDGFAPYSAHVYSIG